MWFPVSAQPRLRGQRNDGPDKHHRRIRPSDTEGTLMTAASSADIIDLLAGIAPTSPLAEVRGHRAQARENAQRSFAALLEPADPGTFPLSERYAVALFVAQLHSFGAAREFYGDLLGDEAPELVDAITALEAATATHGPGGDYREPGLQRENTPVLRWQPSAAETRAFGARLALGLAHTHLLVFRPREASEGSLAALVAGGWSADDVVSLSQLIAFLSFQLRAAWGLRVLGGLEDRPQTPAPEDAVPAVAASGATASGEAIAEGDAAAVAELITSYPDLARPERFTQHGLGWVPWLAPVAEADLTGEQLEALTDPARAKMPYFRLLARDPQALHARTLTDLDIFYNVADGIGRAEREIAAAAASRHNGCVFCASVHSGFATKESGRTETVQRLLDEGITAELDDAVWNAVVSASVALTNTPLAFDAADIASLRAAGLGDAEIIDVVNGAAFFNWANRLMLSLGEPELPKRTRA